MNSFNFSTMVEVFIAGSTIVLICCKGDW